MPELPLFPLRIFEPRYVDMVGRCMSDGGEFGVVLITRGEESGAIAAVADVGTSARIIDFNTLPDGLLGLMCRGARRFRLHSRRQQGDGLHLGTIDWIADAPASALAPEHRPVARVLQRVLQELSATAPLLEVRLDDAGWVADRLAELLPLERAMQQALLELNDPQERMRRLAPLIEVPEELREGD